MVVITDVLLRKCAKGKDLREIKEINMEKLSIKKIEGLRQIMKL